MKKACPELRNCENKNIKALLDRHHIWDRVLEPDVLGTPLNIIAVESVLTHTDWRSWRQAALTAVCRLFGIKFTTARAGARTTRQTANIPRLSLMEGAHPYMLFNLLRCY